MGIYIFCVAYVIADIKGSDKQEQCQLQFRYQVCMIYLFINPYNNELL